MSDDKALVERDPTQDDVGLLYDYSKHLLSLALLGVGGVSSLTQSPLGQKIPGIVVAAMIGALTLSGLCALSCTAAILRARERGQPVGQGAWIGSRLAMMFLGMGVGGFLVIWTKALL